MARKPSIWAKAAGEYYRKNKGKNGIETFSDVLKSDDFKQEYNDKYVNKGKTVGKKNRRANRTRKHKISGGDPTTDAQIPSPSPSQDSANTGGQLPSPPLPPAVPAATTSPANSTPAISGGKRKYKKRTTKKI